MRVNLENGGKVCSEAKGEESCRAGMKNSNNVNLTNIIVNGYYPS